MANNPPFRRVNWIGGQVPYDDPSHIPSDPHNIPNAADLVRRNTGPGYLGAMPSAGAAPDGDIYNIRDPHHYAKIISGYTAAPDGSIAGAQALRIINESNVRRNFLAFRNASATANIFVDFGQVASTFSLLLIAPGQIVLFDTVVPQDDVYVIAGAASGFVAYGFSTILG